MELVKVILKKETFYALGFVDLPNKRTIKWQNNSYSRRT